MKKAKLPIPSKPVTRGKAEKALLWILRNSVPRNSGGRVLFEDITLNRPLEYVHSLGIGTVGPRPLPQPFPSPMEITIKLKILRKGQY